MGDIHGCYGEMVSLLERCGYRLGNEDDRERFSVVLAGDLVNKGPGSVDVVRTAREEGFLAVRGNHDNFALAAATGVGRFSPKEGGGGAKPPPWVEQLSRFARVYLGCAFVMDTEMGGLGMSSFVTGKWPNGRCRVPSILPCCTALLVGKSGR